MLCNRSFPISIKWRSFLFFNFHRLQRKIYIFIRNFLWLFFRLIYVCFTGRTGRRKVNLFLKPISCFLPSHDGRRWARKTGYASKNYQCNCFSYRDWYVVYVHSELDSRKKLPTKRIAVKKWQPSVDEIENV